MEAARRHLVALCGVLGVLAVAPATVAGAATLDVCAGCAFAAVQDAVWAAGDGDLIRVAAGVYAESLGFDKPAWDVAVRGGYDATFSGDGGETVIAGYVSIPGSNSGSVTLERLTIAG